MLSLTPSLPGDFLHVLPKLVLSTPVSKVGGFFPKEIHGIELPIALFTTHQHSALSAEIMHSGIVKKVLLKATWTLELLVKPWLYLSTSPIKTTQHDRQLEVYRKADAQIYTEQIAHTVQANVRVWLIAQKKREETLNFAILNFWHQNFSLL